MNLASASLAGLLAMASAPILMVWMGKLYPGTAFLMSIFAIQQQIHLLTGPGTSILKGIGRPREELFYSVPNIIALAAAIPLSHLILGHWSVVGLGTAVVGATIVSAVGFIVHANRILEIPWRRYLRFVLLPGTVPYLVGLLVSLPAWILIPHLSRCARRHAACPIGILYSGGLMVLVDRIVLESDEREWFRAVIRQRLGSPTDGLAKAELDERRFATCN